jgi:hypothetical protein
MTGDRSADGALGSPLPRGFREQMERSFQADFSAVRVREGGGLPPAGVRAVTRGETIHLGPDSGALDRPDTRSLLGHELAHVLQQREGRAVPTMPGSRTGYARALETEAGRAGEAAAGGRRVARGGRAAAATGVAASLAMQASAPLADAVAAVRADGPGVGSTMVTEDLVRGIREAEGEFLRLSPGNRLAEALGMAGTVGPGQLGEPAIRDVDRLFGTAAASFAAVHGAAPSTWQEKATHAAWSYFYIAAYLAFSINEAHRVFHASPQRMSDADLGLLDLGIAHYHGAFTTIRDMRRRIAGERGVDTADVSRSMIEEEYRSGTATHGELSLERYTMLARGGWDFRFEITAAMLSRRFDVGASRKVRASILANYGTPAPAGSTRASTYTVRLRKREVACAAGACGEGYNNVSPRFVFTVGTRGTAEWTGINPGTYEFQIRKEESTYSPDVLVGSGSVRTIY